MKKTTKLTLSKAMMPGSFLPLRNSHTTEAFSIILKWKVEFDSFTIDSHAIFPTTVMLLFLWLSWLSIWATLEAPFVPLFEWNFTGPIQVTICISLKNIREVWPRVHDKASNYEYLNVQHKREHNAITKENTDAFKMKFFICLNFKAGK